jgi:hypothetical protein
LRTWFASQVRDSKSFALVGCTVAPGFEFEDFELGTIGIDIMHFERVACVVVPHLIRAQAMKSRKVFAIEQEIDGRRCSAWGQRTMKTTPALPASTLTYMSAE